MKLHPSSVFPPPMQSRPVWGAWIEIGLEGPHDSLMGVWSRPVWGAWIEIEKSPGGLVCLSGRAPYGARGLKLLPHFFTVPAIGRAPYGARGLK